MFLYTQVELEEACATWPCAVADSPGAPLEKASVLNVYPSSEAGNIRRLRMLKAVAAIASRAGTAFRGIVRGAG